MILISTFSADLGRDFHSTAKYC